MLNKNVCKSCILRNDFWTERDEMRWDQKEYVLCSRDERDYFGNYVMKTELDNIPVWCPNYVAHLILGHENVE